MNVLFFKYAIEVERTRSISQAAENLFMAQPNLSKAIKEMEDTLGFNIFERSSKGVIPTMQGKEFLVYARNIVSQLEKIDSIAKPNSAELQSLKVSIPRGTYVAYGMANFVLGLDMSKGIDINVQETNSVQTINNIAGGQYGIGIIRYQTKYEKYFLDFLSEKDLRHETIWEFDSLILFSKEHKLANQPDIRYEQLADFIEIMHGDNIVPYLSASDGRNYENHRTDKRICLYERCNQFELLTKVPTTYLWVSPIPDDILRRYDLVQRRCITENRRSKDVLIYPSGYKLTSMDKKFIDKLYEAKNEVAFENYE